MSFVDRFQNEPWFAFSNLAVFGTLGYLLLDRISNKETPPREPLHNVIQPVQERQAPRPYIKRNPIHKIVFSGGPCAGKTTACEEVKKVFEARGYKVMIVPEIAKILVESGAMIQMNRLSAEERIKFQTLVVKAVVHFEDYFVRLAEMSGEPAIVVCDRGTLDVRAYMTTEEFECMIDDEGWTVNQLRDRRYDEVVYLVTAADGADEFYSLSNNVARHETAEEARALDGRTLAAWSGHSNLTILRNNRGETFEDKMDKVISLVERIVGHKEPCKRVEKYLLSKVDFPADQPTFVTIVEDTYLVNESPQEYISDRIQKVDDHGVYHYYRVLVRNIGTVTDLVPNESKMLLTPLEYMYFLTNKKNPLLNTVTTIRTFFVFHKQFFTLSKVVLPSGTIQVLETTTLVKEGLQFEASLPSFIQIQEDVSRSTKYQLSEYAKVH